MNNPLVSVVVPTYNSSKFLERCLESVKNQSYQNIELIVVDNNSTDSTKEIARKYTEKVFNKGPERSAQVNFGVEQASGEFVYKVDSDFVLDKDVVLQCVEKASEGFEAVVVHNSPDTSVSWIAKIRKFEVDMYKYDITHSSARFVRKEVYKKIGGFNEEITAGEDYDFQNKLNREGYKTGFIDAEALHLGEPTSFWNHMKKYYDYGKDFVNYASENEKESKDQLGFFRNVYLRNWKRFVKNPLLGTGFIFYNILKYSYGGYGYIFAKFKLARINFFVKLYNNAVMLNHENIKSLFDENCQAAFIDLGCGDGDITMKVANKIKTKNIYGVEIEKNDVIPGKQKGILIKEFNLNKKFDLEDNFFDIAYSNQVIEHLYDSDNFISEIYRILKPGGYAVIGTENASSWCNIFASIMGWQIFSLTNFSSKKSTIGNPLATLKYQGPNLKTSHHVRIFNIKGLREYFTVFGFNLEKTVGAGYFPFPAYFGKLDKIHSHFIAFKIRK